MRKNLLIVFIILIPHWSLAAIPLNKNNKAPIDIEADKLSYFRDKNLMIAEGHVEIKQNDDHLFADKIFYNKNNNNIFAVGHLKYVAPDGTKFYGDKGLFKKNLTKGILTKFGARFNSHTALAAKYVHLHNENHISAYGMAYSPCSICKNNFISDTPTWEFRADNADIDLEQNRTHYQNVHFEFFDVPILYLPYLNTPAPGAKRRTGLLLPSIEYTNANLGKSIRLPIYINIARNIDSTYTPRITENVGVVHELQFRHKIKNGSYTAETSFNNAPNFDSTGNKLPGKKWIGNLNFNGNFTIPDGPMKGFLTADSASVMDELHTYNLKYGYSKEMVLKTDVNYRKISNDTYLGFRPLFIQDLRPGSSSKTTPKVLPIFEGFINKEHSDIRFFGVFNAVNLMRDQGMNYVRTSGTAGANKKFIFNGNKAITLGGDLGLDLYYVNSKPIYVTSNYVGPGSVYQTSDHRFRNNLFAKFKSSHLFNKFGNSLIIEPIIMPVFTPAISKLADVPNEDSQDPEITPANLFELDRFKGYDIVEDGLRVNYGIMGSLSNQYVDNISFLFGQIWRDSTNSNFTSLSGLANKMSDYVSSIDISANKWLMINNAFRFDRNKMKLLRSENGFSLNFDKINFGVMYSYTNPLLLSDPANQYRQELHGNFDYKLKNGWSLNFTGITRLGQTIASQPNRPINFEAKLVYDSECVRFKVGFLRSFINNQDTKPSVTPMISFEIPSF